MYPQDRPAARGASVCSPASSSAMATMVKIVECHGYENFTLRFFARRWRNNAVVSVDGGSKHGRWEFDAASPAWLHVLFSENGDYIESTWHTYEAVKGTDDFKLRFLDGIGVGWSMPQYLMPADDWLARSGETCTRSS